MKKKITFDPPVKVANGEPISEIVMREPLVKDMRVADRMQGSDLDKEVAMIARLTGVNPDDLDGFSAANYRKLQGEYAAFFGVDGPN